MPPMAGQAPGDGWRSEKITSTHFPESAGPRFFVLRASITAAKKRGSVNLEDASGTNDGRLFLPLRKSIGALAVDIDPRELFAVLIVDGNLPVPVLAPPVFFEPAVFAGSRHGLLGFFGHMVPVG